MSMIFAKIVRLGFSNSICIKIEKLTNAIVIKICEPNIRDAINNHFFPNVHINLFFNFTPSPGYLPTLSICPTAVQLPLPSARRPKL